MKAENTVTGKVHHTEVLADCVYQLCNPGVVIGLQRGAHTFWSNGWDRAKLAEKVTCSKCERRWERNL